MRTSRPIASRASVAAAANAPRAAPTFEPIHTRRAFEEICDRIRAQIAAGTLRPGDKLPAERELALQLGVGRNALREALRSLEIAGIVRLQKGAKGGAFIQAGDASRMNEVVRDMLSLGSISVAELTESRVHIQDLVVRLACERATAADLDALAANIDRTERGHRRRPLPRAGRVLARVLSPARRRGAQPGAGDDGPLGHRDPDAVRLHAASPPAASRSRGWSRSAAPSSPRSARATPSWRRA